MARVLVACEYSGVVRDAFAAKGHDAWSCDLLETERPGQHYQGDVRDILAHEWDMCIAFPPCTHLAVSGARHFAKKRDDGRQQLGIDFFMLFTNLSHIPNVAIENPVGIMSSVWRKPDQIINPWQFGHGASKATCLWLKNIQQLQPTSIIAESYSCACGTNFPVGLGKYGCPNCFGESKTVLGRGHKLITSGGRVLPKWYSNASAKERSKTFSGIAQAMATQWGPLL